jgi:hypothetical protein
VKKLLPIAVSRDDFNVNVHMYYYSVASEGVEFASLVRCGGEGLTDEERVALLGDMFDAYPDMDRVFSVAGDYGNYEDAASLNACVESVSSSVSLDIATKAGLALDILPYTVVHGKSFGGTFPSEYFNKVLNTVH